jgi:type IV secretory pathway TraG/TraD family ATPase VirD4
VFAVAFTLSTSLWLGGRVASMLTGHGFRGPSWSPLMLIDIAHHGGISRAWPGVGTPVVVSVTVVLVLVFLAGLGTAGLLLWRRSRSARRDPARSMATVRDIAELRSNAAAATAVRLRPSLAGMKPLGVALPDRGITLGKHRPSGQLLISSWEFVVLAVFAPRSGKTTTVAVPAICNAPGAVVACSNKPELVLQTAKLRARVTGQRTWIFDPQHIAHHEQDWWWNPLGGTMTLDDAQRLAAAFILTVADSSKVDIWGPAAMELVADLLLAAHLDGKTLLDAYGWLSKPTTKVPVVILREHGHEAVARSLEGMQDLPMETRGSVFFTATAGMASLRDRDISRWVTPSAGLEEFDPQRFPETRETLYMLSKGMEGGTSAAALVSALTSELFTAAERASERQGGRLDPPMVFVLDELANICRIGDLPKKYSHLGSRGVIPIAILQSYAQGERVWGKEGMKELWGAATIKLIGSGADDAGFAEDMSRVIGDHDVEQTSISRGQGSRSESTSLRQKRVMTAADIRALPKSQAILLATGTKAALIDLLPWYTGQHAEEITAHDAAGKSALQKRATSSPYALNSTGAQPNIS